MRVKALRDVDAMINGMKLKAGKQVEAALEDRIVFHNDSELDLIDLRRRARAWVDDSSSKRRSRNIWFRIIRACSKPTISCFRPERAATSC